MQPFAGAPLFCFAHFGKVNEMGELQNHATFKLGRADTDRSSMLAIFI
jgi:hypothetical protein